MIVLEKKVIVKTKFQIYRNIQRYFIPDCKHVIKQYERNITIYCLNYDKKKLCKKANENFS